MFSLAVFVVVLSAAYSLLSMVLHHSQDIKEPQAIATQIPFLSPLYGLIKRNLSFFVFLADKHKLPIYTLRLPGVRVYVVNSTALIPAVQKSSQTLAWHPIVSKVASNVMALDKQTFQRIHQDLNGDGQFLHGLHQAMHLGLSPGTAALDVLNKNAISIFVTSLTNFPAPRGPLKVSMCQWLGHLVLQSITEAIFGPLSPFKNPKVEAMYDVWEPQFINMWLGIAPIVAKDSLHARSALVKAYQWYYDDGGYQHPDASELMRLRHKFFVDFGIPRDEIAKIEVALTFTLLGNARPVIFWLLWHIMSNPTLLADCRHELSEAMKQCDDGSVVLNMSNIKNSCPLLFSTYQEVLRFHGINVSIREVVEDFTLDGRYSLKKGAYIITPGSVQHSNESNWGEDAREFCATRFMRGERPYNHAAFRGWGGGTNLCPGRHFASCGLMAFAAIVILKFNITPTKARWEMPTTKRPNAATAVAQPDYDIHVEVLPNEGRQWQAVYED